MLNEKLAHLFVELGLEGSEQVKAGLAAIQQQFGSSQKAAIALSSTFQGQLAAASRIVERTLATQTTPAVKALSEALVKQVAQVKGVSEEQARYLIRMQMIRDRLQQLTEQTIKYGTAVVENVQRKAMAAFTIATTSAVGFATAGLHSSALGDLLGFKLEQLGRVVGGLVAPEFAKLIDLVDSITNYIRGLSDAQKESLARWLEISAAVLTLSRLFGGWTGILAGLVLGMNASGEASGQMGEVWKKITGLVERLTPSLLRIADALMPIFDIGVKLAELFAGALANALEIVADIFQVIASVAKPVLQLLKDILDITKQGIEKLGQVLKLATAGLVDLTGGKPFDAMGKSIDDVTRKHRGMRDELAKKVGGQEDIFATLARFQQAALKVGGGGSLLDKGSGDVASRFSAFAHPNFLNDDKKTDEIIRLLRDARDGIQAQRPAVGR